MTATPWDFDADRTTRHHAVSIAPPILTIASDFTSDTETLAQYHARLHPRRPRRTRARPGTPARYLEVAMPYIICVNQPGCLPEQDPYAVATIADAREAALDHVWTSEAFSGVDPEPTLQACRDLPEHGGTVGPLPDGYVIDVRRVSWDEFMEGADGAVNAAIDAYNGN